MDYWVINGIIDGIINGIIKFLIKLLSLFIEWKYLAKAKIKVYLTNSDGCRLIPAMLIHRVAPLLSIPKKGIIVRERILSIKMIYAYPNIILKSKSMTIKKIINPNINRWECLSGHELKSPLEILYNAAKPTKNNVIIKPSRG